MKKKTIVLLLALLILPVASPAVPRADTETIRIPASLTAGCYRSDPNGLKRIPRKRGGALHWGNLRYILRPAVP